MDQAIVEKLEPGMDSPLSAAVLARDRDTLKMVDQAVRTGRVTLAYQPIVQATAPDRPAFYEGLLRVLDETGRPIPARDFIEAIEEHETGRIMDCLALEHGLATLARHPGLRLAINMSARSIGYRRWVAALDSALANNPSLANRLILEITETSAMGMPEIVRVFMEDLQAKGITFALDDFGAGYTSFRYLKSFFFDVVKIDGQFVRGIHSDPDNQVLVQALVAIARQFEMYMVAESVETAREAAYLTAIGIDCLQGYHFGAPTIAPAWATRQ
ncbi:MAG: EAL domain-containing protein [Rhodobacteraceae bacterium]|nr:EAL domain-containing protein [Alphaproteobacteria bacterium]NNK66971.1 EAL domain-containing protein [Paracoccaceae bacterium]